MGAWGEQPRENDTALDLEDTLFNSQDPDEQRYGAYLMVFLLPSFPHYKKCLNSCINNLNALLENEEWLERWDHSETVRKDILDQLIALGKMLEDFVTGT